MAIHRQSDALSPLSVQSARITVLSRFCTDRWSRMDERKEKKIRAREGGGGEKYRRDIEGNR